MNLLQQRTFKTLSGEEVSRDYPENVPKPDYRDNYNWPYIAFALFIHTGAVYGLFLPGKVIWTILYVILFQIILHLCINAGAHRLFSHNSFKAKAPLKILLLTFHTFSLQRSMFRWARDHRIHHKYVDTTGDPYNASRGFFFSHMGWLMVNPHPNIEKFGSKILVDDLENDPYVMFQHNNIAVLSVLSAIISTLTPWYFWGESLKVSFFFGFLFRYIVGLHTTFIVNSVAHAFGTKPYDVNIKSVDNDILTFFVLGEAYHNYHHTFPWDYKSDETGKWTLNYTTAFIDLFAKIGWASDMKIASEELIRKRIKRTGPGGSDEVEGNSVKESYVLETSTAWGWEDPAIPEEDKKYALIL